LQDHGRIDQLLKSKAVGNLSGRALTYRNWKPGTRIPAVLRGRLADAIVNVRIARLPTVAGSLSTMRAITG